MNLLHDFILLLTPLSVSRRRIFEWHGMMVFTRTADTYSLDLSHQKLDF